MIRLVIVAMVAIAAWMLCVRFYHFLKSRRIDWTGVAAIIGFVVLAFYLRHVTGIG